ncbi:hypothetical protein HMPREF3293_03026 [Christensenella minuta]|uniref:Uncharacterized protein n=1 Tax=Christensenella minuta TaxID=626937 RepID=A0A136Q100_9FIRM|nr:hypothetical protein HMPREF3293_03026 [Christensenella minuta]
MRSPAKARRRSGFVGKRAPGFPKAQTERGWTAKAPERQPPHGKASRKGGCDEKEYKI